MKHDEYLLLDTSIRDWVVFPILIMLLLVGIGRHYVQQLLKSDQKINEKAMTDMRIKQTLMRAQRLRSRGKFLRESAYIMRKDHLTRKKTGLLRQKCPPPANPMSNPMAMVDMMKGNVVFMVPNFAMMSFVNSFFQGFVCLKVPFPMPSVHFKLMLQRGVDLASLDVSYVSSLCWYFLGTFCLSGVYKLLLGENNVDDFQMQMNSMGGMGMMGGGPGGPGGMGFDGSAAFKGEREMLGIVKHDLEANKAERRLLGDRYPDDDAPKIDLSTLTMGVKAT